MEVSSVFSPERWSIIKRCLCSRPIYFRVVSAWSSRSFRPNLWGIYSREATLPNCKPEPDIIWVLVSTCINEDRRECFFPRKLYLSKFAFKKKCLKFHYRELKQERLLRNTCTHTRISCKRWMSFFWKSCYGDFYIVRKSVFTIVEHWREHLRESDCRRSISEILRKID